MYNFFKITINTVVQKSSELVQESGYLFIELLDADKFATKFMDDNSNKIRKIIKWKDE